LRICSSWFTCCTLVPLPVAMRARREPLMISGLRRSSAVMESTIASTRASWRSSTSTPWSCLPIPGIIPMRLFIGPIFRIIL